MITNMLKKQINSITNEWTKLDNIKKHAITILENVFFFARPLFKKNKKKLLHLKHNCIRYFSYDNLKTFNNNFVFQGIFH